MKQLLLAFLVLLAVLMPTAAHADVGGSIVERLWESTLTTTQNRMRERMPKTVEFFQDAERFFMNGTRDVTNITAVREVYTAMRVAGLLLLGLCTIISLSQLTEAGLMGESANITDWIKRFCVAGFMTMGSIHFYSLWIRVFNAMLDGFRGYLDTHWVGRSDPTEIYTGLVALLRPGTELAVLIFATVLIIVLLILWFLIGGIRVAELAVAVIIAPLVWPVYLIPSLEDIPKTAFRSFLGLNATLLIIVAMLRLAVRMEMGGGAVHTVWNFVPSLAMLILAVFLPTMIKRLVGQGNTGTGGLMTAVYMLAGLKGLTLAAAGGGGRNPAANPPPSAPIPQPPSGPSDYPIAPVPSGGPPPGPPRSAQEPPIHEARHRAPQQIHAGAMAARSPALEAPWQVSQEDPAIIEMGRSDPSSNSWDQIIAVDRFLKGARDVRRDNDPNKER